MAINGITSIILDILCLSDSFCEHEPTGWAYTLNKFLGCYFAKWAHDNPDIWGYEFGGRMWHSKTAFGVADHGNNTNQPSKATTMTTVWDCWVSYVKPAIF
jgi:hypothetical protein